MEVPLFQHCVWLCHRKVPHKFMIQPKPGILCPIRWNRRLEPIVVVVYLMTVVKVQSKCLPVFDFLPGTRHPHLSSFALHWPPPAHQESSVMPYYSWRSHYLWIISYIIDCCLMWHPPTYLHPPPPCTQNDGWRDPLKHFLTNTNTSWRERRHTLPSP